MLDASAALLALMNAGAAREALADEQLHAPQLIDSEIASGLRRQVLAGGLGVEQARLMLGIWQRMGISRYPSVAMLERIWDLRDNLSAYDATYVALAEELGCGLLTADARLSRAPRVRCPVTTVSG